MTELLKGIGLLLLIAAGMAFLGAAMGLAVGIAMTILRIIL